MPGTAIVWFRRDLRLHDHPIRSRTFRIFNPTLQGRRHGPDGDYVRRWVPELRRVAGPAVHDPPPGTYIARIIDHAAARQRTLASFEAARPGSPRRGASE